MVGLVNNASPDNRLYLTPTPPVGVDYFGFTVTPGFYASAGGAVGAGTGANEANARSLTSALAAATAGTNIGVISGTGTIAGSGSRLTPAWLPANSGSSGNPIRIIAKRPWSETANRTELRNSAGVGSGSPTIGSNSRNYIEWYGFYIDEANAPTRTDTGPAIFSDCTGCKVMYCRILGDSGYLPSDNHVGCYFNEATSCELSYNTISGFYSAPGFLSNGAGWMEYGAANCTVENNLVYDVYTGGYIKGRPATNWNWGSRRYNYIHTVNRGMQIQATDPSSATMVEHNVIRSFADVAIFLHDGAGAANTRNVIVQRNTLDGVQNCIQISAITGAGNEFNQNISALYAPNTGNSYMDCGSYTANNFAAFDYDGWYGSVNANPWNWNGTNLNSIANLQAAVANSNNNTVLANDPLSGRGSGNYTVTGAATTAGPGGTPIGADWLLVGPDA